MADQKRNLTTECDECGEIRYCRFVYTTTHDYICAYCLETLRRYFTVEYIRLTGENP